MEDINYDIIYRSEENHWWYKARRAFVRNLLSRYAPGAHEQISVLDLGCGTGGLLHELHQADYRVRGVDTSEKAVEYCKARGITDVSLGFLPTLSFPDDSFDVVLALDVIEHVEDDGAALREIRRILKPGGTAIVTVPAYRFLWGVTDELSRHFRRYTRRELVEKARSASLRPVRSTYFNTLLFLPIAAVRLLARAFRVHSKPENDMGGALVNRILYTIFRFEVFLLSFMNIPFGVSIVVICKKQ